MGRARTDRPAFLVLAGAACLLALVLVVVSGVLLARAASAYRLADISMSETPDSYRRWLVDMAAATEDDDATGHIATRLALMRIDRRATLVGEMMGAGFWTRAAADEGPRRRLMELTATAVDKMLARRPSSGDLWLLASRLRGELVGFDDRAVQQLLLSYQVAPTEGWLAPSRTVFAVTIADTSPDIRRGIERDVELMKTMRPAALDAVVRSLTVGR